VLEERDELARFIRILTTVNDDPICAERGGKLFRGFHIVVDNNEAEWSGHGRLT
jgi:hypothetical protein